MSQHVTLEDRRRLASLQAEDLEWIAGAVEDLDQNYWTESNEAWFETILESFSEADVAAVKAWVRSGKPDIAATS